MDRIARKSDAISPQTRAIMQTLIENKSVVLFPLPKFCKKKDIDDIRAKIDATRAYILSEDAFVCLSEGAQLRMNELAKTMKEDV